MNKPTGGPAFPFGQISELTGQPINGYHEPGMTLRDYFAVRAPAEELDLIMGATVGEAAKFLGITTDQYMHGNYALKARLKARMIWADAMLAERNK